MNVFSDKGLSQTPTENKFDLLPKDQTKLQVFASATAYSTFCLDYQYLSGASKVPQTKKEGAGGRVFGGRALAHGAWPGAAQKSNMGFLSCKPTTHRKCQRGQVKWVLGGRTFQSNI